MKKLMCNLLVCASLASIGGVVASASETSLPRPDMEAMSNGWVETGKGLYADILENYGVEGLYSEGMKCVANNNGVEGLKIVNAFYEIGEIDLALDILSKFLDANENVYVDDAIRGQIKRSNLLRNLQQ